MKQKQDDMVYFCFCFSYMSCAFLERERKKKEKKKKEKTWKFPSRLKGSLMYYNSSKLVMTD